MAATLASRSRYIPWLFVAGFAVVVAVNATMIWLAVGSFSGLYAERPRERGLHYNDVLAAQKARDALGWHVDTSWQATPGRLEIAVTDAAGRPLAGAQVHASLARPVEKRPPLALDVAPTAPGRYAALAILPARGNWDVDIVVDFGGQRYALTRRMFLR
ncbi:FixH family protein [Reyranella sp.]|uniref:FixH family protein n=1 Tax=Reyranella sp. TaxID=1929291 RepID=UPI003BAD6B27